jgi:hypothetical protein
MKVRIGNAMTSAATRGRISTAAVEAHSRQGVDLLAHLHRAELGGVGAAGAAGDHDRDNQDADLPQYENPHHIDGVGFGAELAEVKETLLGNDRPDQKGDQRP